MKIRFGRNNLSGKIVVFCVILGFIISFFAIFAFIIFRFKPVFEEKAECAAKNKANMILNMAISDAFRGIDTEKFVSILKDNDNNISSITTNTAELNKIKTQIYENLKRYSQNLDNAKIYIPIGSLTNYPALQGVGYKIPIKLLFDTTLQIDFKDFLKDAGINQVYYEISVIAVANLDVVSALMISETSITAKIPILQTLIVGAVPSSYGRGYESVRRE